MGFELLIPIIQKGTIKSRENFHLLGPFGSFFSEYEMMFETPSPSNQ